MTSTPDTAVTLGDVGAGSLEVDLQAYGARVAAIRVPLPGGGARQVVVSDPRGQRYPTAYAGATVGRLANRVRDASFVLDGVTHRLCPVENGHTLHGGPEGFDTRTWEVDEAGPTLAVLSLVSPDGDQGFPGTLRVRATFEVAGRELRTTYEATTDAPTHVGLSSHSYFDLDGSGGRDLRLTVPADHYLPVDPTGVPTGEVRAVAGTAFDLRRPVRLADVVDGDDPEVRATEGLDHCFVPEGAGLRTVAVLEGGGLRLELDSDQPGLQVYTGGGVVPGVALEPQHFPDSPHHPEWPSTVLRPGEVYRWRSVLRVLAQR